MKTFIDWLKLKEAEAVAGINPPKFPGQGSWQGAPRGKAEPLSSVGDVKMKKKAKK
jgi:hypothetical protein